jgi:hypothetical protein
MLLNDDVLPLRNDRRATNLANRGTGAFCRDRFLSEEGGKEKKAGEGKK